MASYGFHIETGFLSFQRTNQAILWRCPKYINNLISCRPFEIHSLFIYSPDCSLMFFVSVIDRIAEVILLQFRPFWNAQSW